MKKSSVGSRKRKTSSPTTPTIQQQQSQENPIETPQHNSPTPLLGFPHHDPLDLTLSLPIQPDPVTQPRPATVVTTPDTNLPPPAATSADAPKNRPGPIQPEVTRRRNPSAKSKAEKSQMVEPPYPWATNRRAGVHSLDYLVGQGITMISGDVQCKKCEKSFTVYYNVEEKYQEIMVYVQRVGEMKHRAPKEWLNPRLPKCKYCGEDNSCKPLIAPKKRLINWLFLMLGQMLGYCTLDQLKYFCKHSNNHRTGAKDRVLYLSYQSLCRQLDPHCPSFD